jgi:hypothetical protein
MFLVFIEVNEQGFFSPERSGIKLMRKKVHELHSAVSPYDLVVRLLDLAAPQHFLQAVQQLWIVVEL